MAEDFRELIEELRNADELIEIEKPVDIRHIATLVDQSDKALMFTNVNGYLYTVSGIVTCVVAGYVASVVRGGQDRDLSGLTIFTTADAPPVP